MASDRYRRYVAEHLNKRTLLEQLAEEASELAQASLKMVRALGLSENKTPKSAEEASCDLIEEMTDVRMVGSLLGLCPSLDCCKWQRWAERLGFEERKEPSV